VASHQCQPGSIIFSLVTLWQTFPSIALSQSVIDITMFRPSLNVTFQWTFSNIAMSRTFPLIALWQTSPNLSLWRTMVLHNHHVEPYASQHSQLISRYGHRTPWKTIVNHGQCWPPKMLTMVMVNQSTLSSSNLVNHYHCHGRPWPMMVFILNVNYIHIINIFKMLCNMPK
jgi:hypothetical protein